MRLRFIHAADLHLGYAQYNLDAREDDFARAFFDLVQYTVETQADFLLIAGDLFHRANPGAWTLKQATAGLAQLRDARIPVVAVEGNHDAQHHHKHLSWLEYLCDQNLLSLLNVQTRNGLRSLIPFDPVERRGSWVDLAGARIYGVKYYGAMTARVLEDVREDLVAGPDGYTILMLHAGLEGQVPHLHGGLTHGQIAPLRPAVDYLALGHIHKRLFGEYEWVFNPGSTETNSMEELEWPHGFFDVQVDTDSSPKHTVQPVETPHLRPFRRISVTADQPQETLDEFVARVEEKIAAELSIPHKAVIELHLGGAAQFRRQDVPVERLKGAVELAFSPLTVRLRNNLVPPGAVSVRKGDDMTRAELERQVIEQLVYQHAEYRDSAAAWARLILEVKNMAAENDLAASIVDRVRSGLNQMEPSPTDSAVGAAREQPLHDEQPLPQADEKGAIVP